MKKTKLLFISLGFLIICISCKEETACSDNSVIQFIYNFSNGKCENCRGQEGYNVLDISYIQRTKNAECVNLSNQVLITLSEGKTKEDLGYDSLYEYNFRGAKFDSAELFFNFIKTSDLRGADLRLLQYGYATVDGTTDQYTLLPEQGHCEESENSIICAR